MRLVLAMVLGGLVGFPLSVSAQPAEEDSLSSWQVAEGASLEQPAPEEPALQLKLDEAGVAVVPGYPPRFDELELRVKRAGIGMGVSAGSVGVGGVLALAGFGHCGIMGPWTETCNRLTWSGVAIASAGAVALIATGILYGVRQRERRRLLRRYHPIRIPTHWDEHSYAPPRRVQWDLAQSRLVF